MEAERFPTHMLNPDFFKPEFFATLPADTDDAILAISGQYVALVDKHGSNAAYRNDFIEAYAIVEGFIKSHGLNVTLPPPSLPAIDNGPIRQILQQLQKEARERVTQRTAEQLLAQKREEYEAVFGRYNGYEFSDSDFARIHELLVELRGEIKKSAIPSDHKRRLIKRLEAVQVELKQRTPEIDRFWGFLAEAGTVLRKFGDDLQPLSDRVTELGKIVLCVYMAKEGSSALPGIVDLLTN